MIKTKNVRVICSTLIVLALLSFNTAPRKITVYLIGDSTMANKETKAYPETGWGMPFKYFFDSTVVIDNRAKNGRSSKSFIAENLWQPVVDNLKEGDYVFIQFGHNDESVDKGDRYSSPEDFKKNLTKYITETRAKKANPILITPVARRKFVDGKIDGTHKEYSPLVIEVAKVQHVPLIDLDMKSQALLQKFGEETSKLLFLQLEPGEHPNYPEGKIDNTHFSEMGARLMAQIVLSEVKNQKLELADRIVKPVVAK
ncbi:MAG TPA: rhamnogalacturonan acetylesterase [Cyclobacteriaceae bacterium]|jgi:lysophospholipase L1-like esterase|nr:rhamnogalacturonan acetylesterase [Cyclobacteriaceae bacterium]